MKKIMISVLATLFVAAVPLLAQSRGAATVRGAAMREAIRDRMMTQHRIEVRNQKLHEARQDEKQAFKEKQLDKKQARREAKQDKRQSLMEAEQDRRQAAANPTPVATAPSPTPVATAPSPTPVH